MSQPLIIDHNCCILDRIPQAYLEAAKSNLHIAYGHTSHGSQLTTGMSGLVNFINGGGLGLTFPEDFFTWNDGGTDGALDLHDYAMGGDVGYYPQWVNNTVAYLGEPDSLGRGTNNPDVNVIIWSWCGQVDDKYSAGTLYSEYLAPMQELEETYPAVVFVYMTGHLDIGDYNDNIAANQMIRDTCIAKNKVLYDFADIESYDPDGTYYQYANDNCNYYNSNRDSLGNWAIEWQNSHTEGVEWYNCSSAHSQPLNANRKAYAAWWLWASLAGWNAPVQMDDIKVQNPDGFVLNQNYPNPFNPSTRITYSLAKSTFVTLKVYDILGQEVQNLVNQYQNVNCYSIHFDARRLSGGIYFYQLKTSDGYLQTKKMFYLK
jgi:hypothetical protein